MSDRKTYTVEMTDDELRGLTLVLHSIDAKHLVFKPVSAATSPLPNAVNVPLTTWIGPYGVTVSGFVPNAGFEVQVNQLREVIEDGWLGRDDKEQTHITASIAIPLPEPVTVAGKVEVTP